jgi:hypothetical protein
LFAQATDAIVWRILNKNIITHLQGV